MSEEKLKRKASRIGMLFHEEIEKIKDQRLIEGRSKERVSTGKLTNMITKHEYWKEISKAIIKAPQEEVDKHGE